MLTEVIGVVSAWRVMGEVWKRLHVNEPPGTFLSWQVRWSPSEPICLVKDDDGVHVAEWRGRFSRSVPVGSRSPFYETVVRDEAGEIIARADQLGDDWNDVVEGLIAPNA